MGIREVGILLRPQKDKKHGYFVEQGTSLVCCDWKAILARIQLNLKPWTLMKDIAGLQQVSLLLAQYCN